MKIERILLPFDGSVHSVNATNYALDLARRCGAHVTIVHCYQWEAAFSELPSPLLRDLESISLEKAQDVLKIAENIFIHRGVEYSLEAIYGAPGRVLVKQAESKEYDLIIMGSHGHSEIAGLFLGSVTHRVLNTIYCPILVVP